MRPIQIKIIILKIHHYAEWFEVHPETTLCYLTLNKAMLNE